MRDPTQSISVVGSLAKLSGSHNSNAHLMELPLRPQGLRVHGIAQTWHLVHCHLEKPNASTVKTINCIKAWSVISAHVVNVLWVYHIDVN